MADDRSLADVIRFVDPSGNIGDADIAGITRDLKFTEVLDLITYVGKDDLDSARNVLSKHDERFRVAKEYTFKPIGPQGSSGSSSTMGGEKKGKTVDDMIKDPNKQGDPNIQQIQRILKRIGNR